MVIRKLGVKLFVVAIAVLFIGCGNSATSSSRKSSPKEPQQLFTLPEIPSIISGAENRSQYLAMHYWDNFDFNNQELFENDSVMGIAIGGYIQVLMMSAPSVVEQSVDMTLGNALETGYDQFESLSSRLEYYLYDPNSPMRNEELYIYVLDYIVDKAPLEDIYKIRPRRQLEIVMKNRVGHKATDFSFEKANGTSSTLYAIKSPYTILFFNSPDCGDCARVKKYIAGSATLKKMVEGKQLTILGIYPEKDVDMWRKASYPSLIINGADTKGVIDSRRLYDLKALPTLYLLDSNKNVLLKDRYIEEIEGYLMR